MFYAVLEIEFREIESQDSILEFFGERILASYSLSKASMYSSFCALKNPIFFSEHAWHMACNHLMQFLLYS